MTIRPANVADVPAVLPMVAKICAFHENLDASKYGFLPDVASMYDGWLRGCATDRRAVFLVGERDDSQVTAPSLAAFLIGTVEREIPIYRLKEFGFIHDLWVEVEYRHEGIARQLVTLAIERFTRLGVKQIRCDTAAKNTPAQALFAALRLSAKHDGDAAGAGNLMAALMILTLGTTPTVQRTMIFQRLVLGDVNCAAEVLECASGKSLNVARVVKTLGHEVLATGFAGGGRGRAMCADLDTAGIPHDFVDILANTRVCTTVLDEAGHSHTELVEEAGAVGDEAYAALLAKLRGLLSRAKVLTLSGSLPIGGPVDFYQACVDAARDAGVAVLLDARGDFLMQALAGRPTLVKPNCAELAATLGRAMETLDDLREGLDELVQAGAAWACATMGDDGVLLSDGRARGM